MTSGTVEQCISKKSLLYDKNGEEHYNIISALHKSMRNSDPERENLLFCRAAVKLLAVDKAGVVQNHVVSHFGSALGDGNHARRLLAEPVHLAVQLMLRDRQLFKICLQTLVHKAHDVSSQKLFLMLEIRISPATTRSSAEKPVSKLSEYSTWLLGGNSSSPA